MQSSASDLVNRTEFAEYITYLSKLYDISINNIAE